MQSSKGKWCFEDSEKAEHNPLKCKQSQIRCISVTKSLLERVIRVLFTGFQFILLKWILECFLKVAKSNPFISVTGVG